MQTYIFTPFFSCPLFCSFFLTLFRPTPAIAFLLAFSWYSNSPAPFISPSSFLTHLKQILIFSLKFIPSCSALFLIHFPISHSEVCLIPFAVYPRFSSHCSCYGKGLPPKGNQPVVFPDEVTSLCPLIHLLRTSCWDSAGNHCAFPAAHHPPQILAQERRELLALRCQQRSEVTGSEQL